VRLPAALHSGGRRPELAAGGVDVPAPAAPDHGVVFYCRRYCGICFASQAGSCCNFENYASEYEELLIKTASALAFKKEEFKRDFLEAIKGGYFEITLR